MNKPSDAELRNARAEFRELLGKPTPERLWQRFFAENPFVFSRTLPLKLEACDIVPLGRPGRSEPDFLIYPNSGVTIPSHGLIELKTPDARITRTPRKNVITLAGDAETGVRQLQFYDRLYDRFAPGMRCLSLGSASHLFIVMGMQSEIDAILKRPDLAAQLTELLPPNMRLLPFDVLLQAFEAGLPRQHLLLRPDLELENLVTSDILDVGRVPTMRFDGAAFRIDSRSYRQTMRLFNDVNQVKRLETLLKADDRSSQATHEGLGDMIANLFKDPQSRFCTNFGAFYCAVEPSAALAAVAYRYHVHPMHMACDYRIMMDMHEFGIAATLHDLRSLDRKNSPYLDRQDCSASAALGQKFESGWLKRGDLSLGVR